MEKKNNNKKLKKKNYYLDVRTSDRHHRLNGRFPTTPPPYPSTTVSLTIRSERDKKTNEIKKKNKKINRFYITPPPHPFVGTLANLWRSSVERSNVLKKTNQNQKTSLATISPDCQGKKKKKNKNLLKRLGG